MSADACVKCGKTVGRAGRTNEELLVAHREGTLLTRFGVFDYSTDPPIETSYCGKCYMEVIAGGS